MCSETRSNAKPETVMQHIKRPTVKIIAILLTSIFLTSCNGQVSTVKDPTIDLNEGKLTYSISGEGTTSSWELEILFDQDNALVKETYARGAGRKYLYDKKSNEILGLIDDASSLGIKKDNYFIYSRLKNLLGKRYLVIMVIRQFQSRKNLKTYLDISAKNQLLSTETK